MISSIRTQGKRLFSALMILILLSAGAAFAEETPRQEGADLKLARILSAKNGLFAVDAGGNTWAWGNGGPMLGIPGISKTEDIKKPTLIALKNVVDVSSYGSLNAFLTAEGEVWLAGTASGVLSLRENTLLKSELHQVPVEGVQSIFLSMSGGLSMEETLVMLRKDGSLWAYGIKTGLRALNIDQKAVGFLKNTKIGQTVSLILEDGSIASYRWEGNKLQPKKSVLHSGYTPFDGDVNYARNKDGNLYTVSFSNKAYEPVTTSHANYKSRGLPMEDTKQIRKLFPCLVFYEDGSVWIWLTKEKGWQRLDGVFADVAYSETAGAALLDPDGSLLILEGGGSSDANKFLSAEPRRTSINLYQVSVRKTPKLSAEEYTLPGGGVRAKSDPQTFSSGTLYSKYKAKKKNGLPLYKPASPQPLNVLFTTADGHSQSGGDYTYRLDIWAQKIVEASQGMLRVVTDPKKAEVMIAAKRKFSKVVYRAQKGKKVNVYNCTMTFTAIMLTNTSLKASISDTNKALDSFSVSAGTTEYYQGDPNFSNLSSFTDKILSWYGMNCKKGSKGAGVKRVQQALKTRKLYNGKVDGTFNDKCVQALQKFQESLGYEATGAVDRDTLIWLYYD